MSVFTGKFLELAPAGLVARSSGVFEDSDLCALCSSMLFLIEDVTSTTHTTRASFAGVYESFLCLSSVGEVWDSIRKCWCSAWSPHTIGYVRKPHQRQRLMVRKAHRRQRLTALNMGVEPEPDQMVVIVQQVVPAESAGVILTAESLTGNPWRFVLNSTFGLAQDVVNGTAPADHLVLEWDTGRILEKRIAEKPRALVSSGSGLKKIQLPDCKKKAASVSDETARRIALLALDLDRAFDLRLDIEWAREVRYRYTGQVEGDEIFLIQVRPITALPEFFPHNLSGPDAEVSWKRRGAGYASEQDVVPPFFRGIWESELWTRYQPEDICLGYLEYRERDFCGYRYKTKPRWRDWADIDSLERWLDTNEAKLREQWLRHFEECVRKRKASETEIRRAIQQKQPGLLVRFDKVLE